MKRKFNQSLLNSFNFFFIYEKKKLLISVNLISGMTCKYNTNVNFLNKS